MIKRGGHRQEPLTMQRDTVSLIQDFHPYAALFLNTNIFLKNVALLGILLKTLDITNVSKNIPINQY
jgi:hypothetical protein